MELLPNRTLCARITIEPEFVSMFGNDYIFSVNIALKVDNDTNVNIREVNRLLTSIYQEYMNVGGNITMSPPPAPRHGKSAVNHADPNGPISPILAPVGHAALPLENESSFVTHFWGSVSRNDMLPAES